jgi:hypothetical protein
MEPRSQQSENQDLLKPVLLESKAKSNTSSTSKTEPSRSLSSQLTDEPASVDELLPVFANVLKRLDSMYADGREHGPLPPSSILIRPDLTVDIPP